MGEESAIGVAMEGLIHFLSVTCRHLWGTRERLKLTCHPWTKAGLVAWAPSRLIGHPWSYQIQTGQKCHLDGTSKNGRFLHVPY